MKYKTLTLVAGAATLVATSASNANFLGISLELHSENPMTGMGLSGGFGPSTTYRIYANFQTASIVTAVYGHPGQPSFFTLHSGTIFNQMSQSHHPGGQIVPPSAGQLAGPLGPMGWAFDSYFTLHGLTPQFAPGTTEHIATTLGVGWGWTGSWDGSVDWSWTIFPGDAPPSTKVLLAQLTVSGIRADVGHFEGAWGLTVVGEGDLFDWDGGVDGAGSGLSYFTNIPTPGALALFAICGVIGSRRRRS